MCKQLFLFLIFTIPLLVNAQNLHIVRPDGSVKPLQQGEILPSQKLKLVDKSFVKGSHQIPLGTKGLLDTVYQRDLWPQIDSRFGWQGQDVMIQWFKAPAEMILKSVGFGEAPSEEPNLATQVEVKVVSVNWTEAQLIAATTDSAKHLGYYEAPGNGYNDAEPLIDDFDGINTWSVWHVLDSTTSLTEPFGTDIWSNNGMGVAVAVDPANASGDYDNPTYHWVDMSLLGNEPYINYNQIFGIAIINSNPTVDDYYVRTWSTNLGIPWGAFKYYANGRNNPGVDYGWWARLFAWDFAYVADITSGPHYWIDVTLLTTTLSTGPRAVDAIPNFIPFDTLKLNYSIDNGTSWNSIPMDSIDVFLYQANIPGQLHGTSVLYNVSTKDQYGDSIISVTNGYNIFESVFPTLLVFNGYLTPIGYPQDYYFGNDDFTTYQPFDFAHDVWAFGPLTLDLLNYYNNVLEITTAGPSEINSDTIATWLAASGDRNYMLAGDEWLGAQSGWPITPVQHFAGEFIYDILGIEWEYNDIVNSSADISLVLPVAGSLLGDSLHYLSGVNATDSMLYDPNYEITQVNWLDGVGFLGDVEVDIEGVSLSAGYPDSIFAIGGHRTLAAGNKIVFLSYDPISLNAVPYYWFGFSSTAPQVQVLRWFGADTVTSIKQDEKIPNLFSLSQNYPNPFNPVTKIEYSIANTAKVELIVFDVLGREVAKLVNETKQAGKHEINFDASNYSSGLYFYHMAIHSDKLKAGKYAQYRKMLFLK